MWPQIPESLKIEHEELHADLVRATELPGAVGEAATGARDTSSRYISPPGDTWKASEPWSTPSGTV